MRGAMRARTKVVGTVLVAGLVLAAGAMAGAQVGGGGNGGGEALPRAGAASPAETGFVPITPCRVVNTQNPAGRFGIGEVRSYRTQGNLTAQGGAASCGIPTAAVALEMTVTAVGAEGEGYIRAFPAGQATPTATLLNYTDAFNVGTTGTVRVRPGSAANLSIRNFGVRTHVVIDVLGYYVPGLMAVVGSNGGLVRGSGVVSAARTATGTYSVRFDRTVSGCAYTGGLNDPGAAFGNEGDIAIATLDGVPSGVYVQTFNALGTLANTEFHLVVTC